LRSGHARTIAKAAGEIQPDVAWRGSGERICLTPVAESGI